MNDARDKAIALVGLGIPVFKVRVGNDGTKTPMHPNGHLDATLDPGLADDWFSESPRAQVGAYMGAAGLLALDVDVKNGKDGWDSLEKAWVEITPTFSYDTPSGGQHLIYSAPEGINLAPHSNYRGMPGVDIRAGSSWVLWNGPVPKSREEFSPAPEWACDSTEVKSAAVFEGDVQEWYETLEPGNPSLLVRNAMEDARKRYEENGNDLSHSDIIEFQHRAVRLGAERNPGVPEFLTLLEDMTLEREGEHSRSPEEYAYEFAEGLASGVKKYGAAIELWSSLPEYSLDLVPKSVSTELIHGAPGTKSTFTRLLRELQEATEDDLLVTSVLWNSPRTRDLAREWGLEFVHQRVSEARQRPEPMRENPTLPDTVDLIRDAMKSDKPRGADDSDLPRPISTASGTFLTPEETELVANTETFIDAYRGATHHKGFTNETYVPPVAWTVLSMAFGRKAFIPLAKSLEVNLWFIVMGESTTGKGTEDGFFRQVMHLLLHDENQEHYNLGALSSPDGLHMSLLQRDGLPSIIHNDEAADFFRDIRGGKDWMTSVPDKLSKWYDGWVEPSSKLSLKDLKGKAAHTSLNQLMWGTPDRLLELMDASQFQSGYLARVSWIWDTTIPDPNRKSNLRIQPDRKRETPDEAYDLAADLRHAGNTIRERIGVDATGEAQDRLNQAADDFEKWARTQPRYDSFKPSVDRLKMETVWKLSALLALYRGDSEFDKRDALVAISYAGEWLKTAAKVAGSISESPYSRDAEAIEKFVREEGGTVTREKLLHNFRGLIVRSRRELDDRLEFLVDSGRVLREQKDQTITYRLNGG